ncbi:hypothetical protein CASFOL_041939 [Castilleja foliolosa]|uniref:RNase H type-1 domain-containing protein n=1 Tax=Castilleja foliolosa TaxID=1961234 RepID=A0ABD3B938_9LAMI
MSFQSPTKEKALNQKSEMADDKALGSVLDGGGIGSLSLTKPDNSPCNSEEVGNDVDEELQDCEKLFGEDIPLNCIPPFTFGDLENGPCWICDGPHSRFTCGFQYNCPLDLKVGEDYKIICICGSDVINTKCVMGCTRPVGQNALPVDDKLSKLGVVGPFKCVCCKNGGYETLNHLFINGEQATQVWKHFGNLLKISVTADRCKNLFLIWMRGQSTNTQGGTTVLAIFAYSLWYIWKARCTAKFEGTDMNANGIIKQVTSNVQNLNLLVQNKKQNSKWDLITLDKLKIPSQPMRTRVGSWVKWEHPKEGEIKVSVDASLKNGRAHGGGIIRGKKGIFLAAFSCSLNAGGVVEAETEAICKGVALCKALNLDNYTVETDSKQAIKSIHGNGRDFKAIYLARTHALESEAINHIWRQQNAVADKLAKLKDNRIFTKFSDLPSNVRQEIYFNRIGIPALRKASFQLTGGEGVVDLG